MQANNWKTPLLGLAMALSLVALALPAAADTGDAATTDIKVDKDVRVKVIKCEGDECAEMVENLTEGENAHVIVGDGSHKKIVIRKVHCDGEDCDEEEGIHNMVFVGDDGNVEVLAGGEGHAWVSHHGAMGGGYLGVGLTELTPELREHFGVPAGAGVMVSKVMDESPAFKAGLEVGDIIATVDGETVADGSALARMIRGHAAADEVVLDVWRDGVARSITAAVEERTGRVHLGGMNHPGLGKHMRKIMVRCDSDDEDCRSNVDIDIAGLDDFDCGGSEECEVKVQCKDGGCTCSINGEDADCADIPGVPGE